MTKQKKIGLSSLSLSKIQNNSDAGNDAFAFVGTEVENPMRVATAMKQVVWLGSLLSISIPVGIILWAMKQDIEEHDPKYIGIMLLALFFMYFLIKAYEKIKIWYWSPPGSPSTNWLARTP